MQNKQQVAVLGGGSFGTAIANILADNQYPVCLWMRNQDVADSINRQHINSRYFPNFQLNPDVVAFTDLALAVAEADYIYVAVPSLFCRPLAQQLKGLIKPSTKLVSLTKGIEAETFCLMSQVLAEELAEHHVGVLSGPNLAKEIVEKHLTATVIASKDKQIIMDVQTMLHTSYFRVYASSDMYGVELGGALKNCYAIMCGMAAALGSGQNTIGMLLTRSLAEMSRFAVQLGADPMTFLGLAGVGDLIVTCMSPLSRNYKVGYALGQGEPLDKIINELGQVAEGVKTLQLVREKAKQLNIYMPLVSAMYEILHEGKNIAEAVGQLMSAEQNTDVEFAMKADVERI
jgi:glycerol-3-phosphate dehydrogenase (NAD(P)+)